MLTRNRRKVQEAGKKRNRDDNQKDETIETDDGGEMSKTVKKTFSDSVHTEKGSKRVMTRNRRKVQRTGKKRNRDGNQKDETVKTDEGGEKSKRVKTTSTESVHTERGLERDGNKGRERSRFRSSTSSTGSSQSSTSQRESIVVLYTADQASALVNYMTSLQKEGKQPYPVNCIDTTCFSTIDASVFSRIDVLASDKLCEILMKDGFLQLDVQAKLIDFKRSSKPIHMINMCPGSEDINDLYHKLPRKSRKVFNGIQYTSTVPIQQFSDRGSTGMKGGRTDRSNVAGAAHAGRDIFMGNKFILMTEEYEARKEDQGFVFNNTDFNLKPVKERMTGIEPNTIRLTVDFPKEMKEQVMSDILPQISKSEGVQRVNVEFGSIIFTLTLEDDYVITEEWKRTILRTLFSGKLVSYIAEGEAFSMTIQRYIVHEGNAVTSLYEAYASSFRDNSGVIRTGLHSPTQLQSRVSELEQELERMQMADAKWMLLMKRDIPIEDDSTSGFHSTVDSAIGSTEDGDTDRMKGREGMNLPAPMKWDIEEGDTKLLVYSKNDMLNEACRSDKLDIVKGIVSSGLADINNKSEFGWTPVLITVWKCFKQLFDVLVKAGCDLSAILDNGQSILHLACLCGNYYVVNYIISNEVIDIENKGMYGCTAVMNAVGTGQKKIFDYLVNKGCDLSGVDDAGNNILHRACLGGSTDIVRYILTRNIAGIESTGQYGRTPVMVAASEGQKKVFDLLVSEGCDLSAVDDQGSNILHMVAMGGNVGIVEQILTDLSVDINSRNKWNNTPLKLARYYKHDDVVRLLLERGAVDR